MKKIICLHGGPGSGKSTICAGLFYRLQINGFNCEMNREYVKEWAWEGRNIHSGDQTYIFAKQSRGERMYIQQNVDFIITDSPLILTHFYGMLNDRYEREYNTSLMMLKNHHEYCKNNGYKTEHFLLKRNNENYVQSGRYQTKTEAQNIDTEIKKLLDELNIKYTNVLANEQAVDIIFSLLNINKGNL